MKKTVGILVDDYKVAKYEEKLKEKGFVEFTTHPFKVGIKTIRVVIEENQVSDINDICVELEKYFKKIKLN